MSLFAGRAAMAATVVSIALCGPAFAAKPADADTAKSAPKAAWIKPVSTLPAKPAPAAVPAKAQQNKPNVDHSEREIWRHHGVG